MVLKYLLPILLLPFLPLISVHVCVKGLHLMLSSHDERYTFGFIDGLYRWRGRRIPHDGILALICVAGVICMTTFFALVQLHAYLDDKWFWEATDLGELKERLSDPAEFARERHETTKQFRSVAITREHEQVVLAIRDRIRTCCSPDVLELNQMTLPVIAVQFEGVEQSFYWHVEKHVGPNSAQTALYAVKTVVYPREGFALFQARYDKYALEGVAPEAQMSAIRSALEDADDFVDARREAE